MVGTLIFNPTGWCPAYEIPIGLSAAVAQKNRRDETQMSELVNRGIPTVPVRTGTDGGMHPLFRNGPWASNGIDVD